MSKNYLEENIVSDIESILLSGNRNKKHTILAVDDEQNNLSFLHRTLRGEYNILLASSGEEALEFVEEYGDEISLIVSDQKMPIMEGTEFFKRISENYPHIIKILLTGCDKTLKFPRIRILRY